MCCNKYYQHKFEKKLNERLHANFSIHNSNTFILLLQKGVYPYEYMDAWEAFNETVYPYEYMDAWEAFNETLLLEKEDFYSYLIMADITDPDYVDRKRVYKDF